MNTINDIQSNAMFTELTPEEVASISGGWVFGDFYSTADLHKSLYGDESPYGRDPKAAPFN